MALSHALGCDATRACCFLPSHQQPLAGDCSLGSQRTEARRGQVTRKGLLQEILTSRRVIYGHRQTKAASLSEHVGKQFVVAFL